MFRNVVNKIITKDKGDASSAPTLHMLLQPKASRNFPKDVEAWLGDRDIVGQLENLASHLVRTMPPNEVEEMDKWLDGQRVSKATVSAIPASDVEERREVGTPHPGVLYERGTWMGKPVEIRNVLRDASSFRKGLAKVELKTHHHRLTCMGNAGPFLASLRHDNVWPTYGYCADEERLATVHPPPLMTFREELKQRAAERRHLSGEELVHLATDLIAGLGHMHALGFLHRNLSCLAISRNVVGDGYAIGSFGALLTGRLTCSGSA